MQLSYSACAYKVKDKRKKEAVDVSPALLAVVGVSRWVSILLSCLLPWIWGQAFECEAEGMEFRFSHLRVP